MVAAVAQNLETGEEEAAGPSSVTPAQNDDTAALHRFLETVWVIRNDEDPMTLSKWNGYACRLVKFGVDGLDGH